MEKSLKYLDSGFSRSTKKSNLINSAVSASTPLPSTYSILETKGIKGYHALKGKNLA
jgi:hypothetical protein